MNVKENPKDFGTYLKYLRDLRSISITNLAKLSDVSPSYISRIENGGRRPPKPDILKKIAPHLGIGYNELMAKAGYLIKNNEDLRIEDEETKELFLSLTEGKKELLRTVDSLSEKTIHMIAKTIQMIKAETRADFVDEDVLEESELEEFEAEVAANDESQEDDNLTE